MSIESILAALDDEIKHLQQVRSLISTLGSTARLQAATTTKPVAKKRKRSELSADARKRIADAQRKRWAKQKAAK